MSQKLGRNYSLTITGPSFTTPLVITLPFTIEFDITRNTLTSANVCQIRIYNLSPTNRNALRRNDTSYGLPFTSVVLRAGYSNDSNFGVPLPTIFSGNISSAWSVREGVNFVTQLECYDGGFAFVNGTTNLTFPKGTPDATVIASLITSLPDVALGGVGGYTGITARAKTYSGNTIDILRQLTGGGFFVDNGIGYALKNNEYSLHASPPLLIDASTGLLNTPILEQTKVRFDMIFEPNLVVGSGVNLQSSTASFLNTPQQNSPNFNGFYKVTSVKHRGMISETVCGDAVTTGEFFFLATPTPVVAVGSG